MRKNLMRIASLVVAFALLSVPTFAALTGSYANGTFKVEGGATGLQTSLIIVEGAYTSLPVANEAVTGAVYIDQVASAANGAAFGNVALDAEKDVHTAFFSNESENSASSAKIVTASVSIAIGSETTTATATAGDDLIITVNKTASVTDDNTDLKVGDEVVEYDGSVNSHQITWTAPETAGEYKIKLVSTIEGVTVESNEITVTVTAAPVVLDPVTIAGDDTILDLVVSPTTEFTAQPVGIKVTFPDADKTVDKMIWAFETAEGIYYSDPVTLSGVTTVSGDTVFAAVVKNGTATDGVSNEDAITINKVGAIFSIGGQNFYTNTAYDDHKKTN